MVRGAGRSIEGVHLTSLPGASGVRDAVKGGESVKMSLKAELLRRWGAWSQRGRDGLLLG